MSEGRYQFPTGKDGTDRNIIEVLQNKLCCIPVNRAVLWRSTVRIVVCQQYVTRNSDNSLFDNR